MTVSLQADGKTISLAGTGSGTSTILNPDECADTGECHVEILGTFDASEAGVGKGTVRLRFVDDWSKVLSGSMPCTVPGVGDTTSVWETTDGEGIFMTQTSGFVCPLGSGNTSIWKRFLRE